MTVRAHGIRMAGSIAVLCVLAAATAVPGQSGEAANDHSPSDGTAFAVRDLAGRWQGRTFELSRRADCGSKPCVLTLDISRCANGWCGVEVLDSAGRCGATALKLDGGADTGGPTRLFKGSLELAKGTEPYVVEAYLMTADAEESPAPVQLEITGDTGGAFRMFRRTFPFNAVLARMGDPSCRPESTVSRLD